MVDYTAANAREADLTLNAGELRRARIGVKGNLNDVSFKVELNTDRDGEIELADTFVEFASSGDAWTVRAGQFKVPNGLDEQTSSRFATAIERAAFTDAFLFDRRVGVSASTKGQNWTLSIGAFVGNLNDTPTQEGIALATRYTHVPFETDNALVHLGVSARYAEAGDRENLIRNRQRPFTHLPGRIVSTGPIASSETFFGIETAGLFGSAFAASEIGTLNADGPTGSDYLTGGYIEGGYFFGGRKEYKNGKFDRPTVTNPLGASGYGAVAIFARVDLLDLTNGTTDGGSLETIVVGADWYPTTHTRLAINLFQSDATFGATNSGLDPAFVSLRDSGATGDQVTGAVVRFGFDF